MTTVHLAASTLRDLLAPVLPFADKGDSLPVLAALRVRGHGDRLTAFATDRYRAAVKRVNADAPAELDVILPVTSARQMLAMFKPTRSLDPELTLTFEPGKVTIESGAMGLDLLDARISFPLLMAEYPRALHVLIDAAKAEAAPLPPDFALNAHFLADYRHIVSAREPMRIHVGKIPEGRRGGPVFIAVGDDFRSVLMSLTQVEGTKEPLLGDSWLSLLGGEPKKEKAA